MISSGYYSRAPGESLAIATQLVIGIACATVVCQSVLQSHPPTVLLDGFALGCGALAASTLLLNNQVAGRNVGLGSHPVEIGATLSIAIAYTIFRTAPRGLAPLRLPAVVVLVAGVLQAASLTGLVAAAISALSVVVLTTRSPTRVLTATLATLFAFLALRQTVTGSALLSKATSNFGAIGSYSSLDESTLSSRILTIKLGVERSLEHPFVGSGFDPDGTRVLGQLGPHNVIVNAWLAGGIFLALAITIAMIVSLSRTLRHVLSLRPNSAAVMAAVLTTWLGALSGPQLLQRTWLLPVLAALFMSLDSRISSRIERGTADGHLRNTRSEIDSAS